MAENPNRSSSTSSDDSDVEMYPDPRDTSITIPPSPQATAAALATHRRAETFSIDSYRRSGPPRRNGFSHRSPLMAVSALRPISASVIVRRAIPANTPRFAAPTTAPRGLPPYSVSPGYPRLAPRPAPPVVPAHQNPGRIVNYTVCPRCQRHHPHLPSCPFPE